jgi:hypothetical protein
MPPRHSTEPSVGLLTGLSVDHLLKNASDDAFPHHEGAAPTTGFAACALPPDRQAAGEARRFTWSTLSGWDLSSLVDNAALIVSELLSNALRYGLTPTSAHLTQPGPVWLGLLRRSKTVLCAVCDHSTAIPVLRRPDYFAQSGRGLHIVDCLSEAWGWTDPGPSGKAVWASVTSPITPPEQPTCS